MSDIKKVYWDACVWIGLINQEAGKVERAEYILSQARTGALQIWTSALTLAEVFKKTCEGKGVALPDNKDVEFEKYVQQNFLVLVQVDFDVGVMARRLLRQYPPLKKVNDGIHLATAVVNNLDELHTFDVVNLIALNGELNNHRLKPVGFGLRTESPDTRRLNDASIPAPS